MNAQNVIDGLYAVYPEGSGWNVYRISEGRGRRVGSESEFSTHRAARDGDDIHPDSDDFQQVELSGHEFRAAFDALGLTGSRECYTIFRLEEKKKAEWITFLELSNIQSDRRETMPDGEPSPAQYWYADVRIAFDHDAPIDATVGAYYIDGEGWDYDGDDDGLSVDEYVRQILSIQDHTTYELADIVPPYGHHRAYQRVREALINAFSNAAPVE